MSISIIVAVANDNAIGRDGNQPFFISADLRRFKALTMGHPIIMGRKTFEALPKGALPGRRNIVVSRNASYEAPGAETVGSIDEAMELCEGTEAFVIGGGSIYAQAMPKASKLYLTRIYADAPGADVFFPAIGPEWREIESEPRTRDEKTGLEYQFIDLER